MLDLFYTVFDLAHHALKGSLLVYLLRELVPVKNRFVKYRRLLSSGLVFQYTVFYAALSYCKVFRTLFYEGMDAPATSRLSIMPLCLSMMLTIIFCMCFYGGRRSSLLYLVFTYYTVNELVMFTLHSLFSFILRGLTEILNSLIIAGNEWVLQNFYIILEVMQAVWNLSFQIVFLTLLFISVRHLKKNLSYVSREVTPIQQLFLAVPSIMGLCFCVMLRSILYVVSDVQTEFLVDNFPETGILIPVISGLCLISVILSAVILKQLRESNEKEVLVEVYQNRISDMEEHMKDVEHLYDGIRGMRHDMKNYVADLEILLRSGNQNENADAYQNEICHYLDGLCDAIEKLEMKCNTGNPVTDVVISRKARVSEEKNIPFACDFVYPERLGISAFDISIILNNGLDNAIEAAEKEKEPYIHLDSYIRENMFFIEIRNSFTGSLNTDKTGKNLYTNKEEAGHGLGLKNMKGCAAGHYGKVEWSASEKEFLLTVMLQGKQELL